MPYSVTYVTDSHHNMFRPYFKEMIRAFENSTHKPTERRLDSISVVACNFSAFHQTFNPTQISGYKMGEWMVELLCLIPIHIAVARENRFVPLNNGIIDPWLENHLLGADVSQIVDALNLGWYESIFNSYLATKPVKVISSMGEQSVGTLNCVEHMAHLNSLPCHRKKLCA